MTVRYLDLNIQRILTQWSTAKALSELIANALDEMQVIAEQKEDNMLLPEIKLTDDILSISDRGRGIDKQHFIQNANCYKRDNPLQIGKFGVGLKDAIGYLHDKGKQITIESRHLYVSKTVMRQKQDFEEEAIHVKIQPPRNEDMVGTVITVSPITSREYKDAKSYFCAYANLGSVGVKTPAGTLYPKHDSELPSYIFVNGFKVNEETNFMFHYAIMGNTKQLMQALSANRDRGKITKADYGDKVQQILIYACKHSQDIRDMVREQFEEGPEHHEFRYAEVKKLKADILTRPTLSQKETEKAVKLKLIARENHPSTSNSQSGGGRGGSGGEEEEQPIPPKVRLVVRRDSLLEKGESLLKRLFGKEVRIQVKGVGDKTAGSIYVDQAELQDRKEFYVKIVRRYLRKTAEDEEERDILLEAIANMALTLDEDI